MPDTATIEAPTLRPGEKLVAGRPYIFDHEALNDHLAEVAVATAPADLSPLTDSQLSLLVASCIRVGWLRHDEAARTLHGRALAERAARVEGPALMVCE